MLCIAMPASCSVANRSSGRPSHYYGTPIWLCSRDFGAQRQRRVLWLIEKDRNTSCSAVPSEHDLVDGVWKSITATKAYYLTQLRMVLLLTRPVRFAL